MPSRRSEMTPAAFKARFQKALASLRGRGCKYCTHPDARCFEAFRHRFPELEQWRHEFEQLPKDVQRMHLLYLFYPRAAGQLQVGPAPAASPGLRQGVVGQHLPSSSSSGSSGNEVQPKRPRLAEAQKPPPEHCQFASTSSETASDHDPKPTVLPTSESDVEEAGSESPVHQRAAPTTASRRAYPKQRGAVRSIPLCGEHICVPAARFLLSKSPQTLQRIRDGKADGRKMLSSRMRGVLAARPQATSVWRFLWRLYHWVGQGSLDKFHYARTEAKTVMVECKFWGRPPKARSGARSESDVSDLDQAEEANLKQQVANAAALSHSVQLPPNATLVGPNMLQGPPRFLGPGRRIYLYLEYCAWMRYLGQNPAHFTTFLRVLKQASGQLKRCPQKRLNYQQCDFCEEYKKLMRTAHGASAREEHLQAYLQHTCPIRNARTPPPVKFQSAVRPSKFLSAEVDCLAGPRSARQCVHLELRVPSLAGCRA